MKKIILRFKQIIRGLKNKNSFRLHKEAAYVAKELNAYCSAVNPSIIKNCFNCKIVRYCQTFVMTIPSLHLAIVDAVAEYNIDIPLAKNISNVENLRGKI